MPQIKRPSATLNISSRFFWISVGGPKKDHKFVTKMIMQTSQPEIKVVTKKYGSPTYGKDLINAVKKLILQDKAGIFHLSNQGAPSRADVVSEIIKITNSTAIMTEVDQSFFDKDNYQKRPDNESMTSRTSIMRPWQDAVREYILKEWKD